MAKVLALVLALTLSACAVDASKFDKLTDKDRRELQKLLDNQEHTLFSFEIK